MKKNTRNGIIVLFVVILIAIVITGQQFSTIGSTILPSDCSNPDDCTLDDERVSASCDTQQDCIDYIKNIDPTFDTSSIDISCVRGVCEGS